MNKSLPGDKFKFWFFNNFYGNDYSIGKDTQIGSFCDIGGIVGKNCIIQSYVFIPPGVTIGDNCFIGPGVIFTNVKNPPLKKGEKIQETTIGDGVVIGARAVILPGLEIGDKAMIGAGAVVTKDVPAGEVWVGNPASKLLTKKKE